IDGVFNHVGIPFWAFQDVKTRGRHSPYADWFIITAFDNPATPQNEFQYRGWYGVPDLPELREDQDGPPPSLREHLHRIVRRWMDPNGDGDPSDGIDGWRLDVAEMVSMNFWREFSRWVREINPRAYLTAEIWWEDYPRNVMFNAAPWIGPDGFDAVMNYRFADAMYKFFNDEVRQITAGELDGILARIRSDYGLETSYVLQNLMDSHDMERLASAVVNPDRWIDHGSSVQHNPGFNVRKPNAFERQKQKVIVTFQFTYLGAPYIYYGDEVGMWGADDPDCRKPMVWPEMVYEPERHHPLGRPRQPDSVFVDEEMVGFYKTMIRLRQNHPALRRGTYRTVLADNETGVFAFRRELEGDTVLAVFNGSTETSPVPPALLEEGPGRWTLIFGDNESPEWIRGKSAKIYHRD
ncbi:MAG: alpha-amylase family glycosyl hydrolase, partial [Fidelibacterota bacterium]